ncbi:MAG: SapC family protein [Xanthomonadales bacterium]|nr:SapC family protein [Gammaproteobacteria bacterium]NNJ65656.1 SapC family protein [Xanthomonadales bacterium]
MANYQLLNNVEHKDLKIIIDRSAALGDNVWYAVTFPTEFRALQRHYPVFFIKNSDTGEFQAVAMFGVEDGENLFLDETGWNATYIPLNIMRQPFLIGYQEQETGGGVTREPVVTIDMDSPRVNTEAGEPVFLEHGGNSEYLEQVNSILQMLLGGMKSCKGFFNTLEEFDLLESFVLDAQLYDGSEHRLAGFYTINEEALAKLDGAELELLHKKGYLEPIYMAIASMTNLPLMLEKKNQMRRAEAEHAEH